MMYLGKAIFGGVFILFGALAGLALLIVIWVLVEKDARRNDITPSMMWGAIAALVPGFIGLVGYMVVRYISTWNKKNGQQ